MANAHFLLYRNDNFEFVFPIRFSFIWHNVDFVFNFARPKKFVNYDKLLARKIECIYDQLL